MKRNFGSLNRNGNENADAPLVQTEISVSTLSTRMERQTSEESFTKHILRSSDLYRTTQNNDQFLGYAWHGKFAKNAAAATTVGGFGISSEKTRVAAVSRYLQPISLEELIGDDIAGAPSDLDVPDLDELFAQSEKPCDHAEDDIFVQSSGDSVWQIDELESRFSEDANGNNGGVKNQVIAVCSEMGPCFRILCRQISSDGGREYATAWMPEFWDRVFALKDPFLCTFNELVPSQMPCKLYMDLDLKLKPLVSPTLVDKARWLSALEKIRVGLHSFCCFIGISLKTCFGIGSGGSCVSFCEDDFLSWTILDASSLEKISKHVVFNVCGNSCLFKTKRHCENFLKNCLKRWKSWVERAREEQKRNSMPVQDRYSWNRESSKRAKLTECPSPKASASAVPAAAQHVATGFLLSEVEGVGDPKSWDSRDQAAVIEAGLDWNIYSGEKEFRLMGSTKFGEKRPLELESISRIANDVERLDSVIERIHATSGEAGLKLLSSLDGLCVTSHHLRISANGTKKMCNTFVGGSLSSVEKLKLDLHDCEDVYYDDDNGDGNDDNGSGNLEIATIGGSANDGVPSISGNVTKKSEDVDLKAESLLSLVIPFFAHTGSIMSFSGQGGRYDFTLPEKIVLLSYGAVIDDVTSNDSFERRKSILRKMSNKASTCKPRKKASVLGASTAEAFYSSSYYNTRPCGKTLLENLPSWVSALNKDERGTGDLEGSLTMSELRQKFAVLRTADTPEEGGAEKEEEDEQVLACMTDHGDDPLGANLFKDIGENIMRETGMIDPNSGISTGHSVFFKSERRTPDGLRFLIYNTDHKYKMCYTKAIKDGVENAKHTNNNVFFVVCLNNFTYYQKCHSAECRNYYYNSFVLQRKSGSKTGEVEEPEGTKELDSTGDGNENVKFAKGPVKRLDAELWNRITSFLQFDDMLGRWDAYDRKKSEQV